MPPRARARAAAVLSSLVLAVSVGGGSASAAPAGAGARDLVGSSQEGAAASSALGTAWTADVSRAPLHPNSRAMASNLAQQVSSRYGGVAAFNVWQYNTAKYTVPASQRRVNVAFHDCQGKGYTPSSLYGPGGHFTSVPIPDNAVPATGTDGQLTIHSPSTDQLWEFWKARKSGSTWSACWGGRIDKVSQSPGFFRDGMGASASGLAVSMGAITVAEARARRIDHAMSLAVPSIGHWRTWSYPAQRSDGSDTRSAALPMGTRLRLDPSVDVSALRLHPVAADIARAAQKYGFVVTDTSGAVAVTAESGEPFRATTGGNPWYGILGSTKHYSVMERFPWDKLQVVQKDWGKPASP